MRQTCPLCHGTEFHASQVCRGTIPVVVVLEPNGPVFLRNATEDGELDVSDLAFDDPEGPFACVICGTVVQRDTN
jgi:hypothetical protein